MRTESIGFSEIPGQTALFLKYQSDPLALRKYYPTVVRSHDEIADRAAEVLAAYKTDRERLRDLLVEQNKRFGAGDATFENIERLRRHDTVAVITGQQTGLLTGPLYTVYKALSAIKLSQELCARGIPAVPVFWAATEDHDFAEIAEANVLDADAHESKFRLEQPLGTEGLPVGGIEITASFDIDSELADIWKPGTTIGNAFCRQLQNLFRQYGLIVVDPLDAGIKQLVAPVYARAASNADAITDALITRSSELEADGYHSQVLITPDYFPLFYHTDDGVRRAIRKKDGTYHIAGTKSDLALDDIVRQSAETPERFSPNVMLRPVVQDYLFPTICYFGGGAEIAYFGQNSEVYRLLERPATPILHRQSFTVVEAKHARTLEKFELKFVDLFAGLEALLPRIVDRFVNPSTSRLFADAEDNINVELNRLDQELSNIDPTLAANLATRRRKIMYHISALRNKFRRVQVEKDEMVNRRIGGL
ncbi:MAG TPA: bacillithiol biosynthesis cysteine-adding enzyme BshC, partial [Pyrinomonadaceae bacterium]|nr:bacillithiol biosynthesis cysteine-adding enzyme BshC [Pyrinomonadaceae bacterium]